MRVLLALVPMLLLVPNASAAGTASCHIGNDAIVLAGSCHVTTPAAMDIQVSIAVWQHATGLVHVDMVNSAPNGDHIEFECYLASGIDPCTPVVETGGYTYGTWTVTAYAGDANAAWVFLENADVDVTVTYA